MYRRGTDSQTDGLTDGRTDIFFQYVQAKRGFATSRLHSDEDGSSTNILVLTLWCRESYIKKGGGRSAGYGLIERF